MGKQLAQLAVIVALIGALCLNVQPARAGTTITVNTEEGTVATNGNCSLPEAVQAANGDLIVDACPAGSGTDSIAFKIGSSGSAHTIMPASTLAITAPVVIDGTTQPGYAGIPLIRVDGNNAVSEGFGFYPGATQGANSVLKGLMITRFSISLVRVTVGDSANHVTLLHNYIGTDGTNPLGGTWGVDINGGKYAQVGGPNAEDRNVISGNVLNVGIYNSGDFNTIQGNYIGLNDAGTNYIAGTQTGVLISYASTGAIGNHIFANVIAGGSSWGIHIASPGDNDNLVRSNYIGTNASGTAAVRPGVGVGIALTGGDGNIIGGSTTGDGNLLSGTGYGVGALSPATNTTIVGNRIGTNAAGTASIPNALTGIYVQGTAANIGDARVPGHNLISGNGMGIWVTASGTSGTTIVGNRIGLNVDGSGLLPNGIGVSLTNSASARIAENWIGGNSQYGIHLDATSTLDSSGWSVNSGNCIVENSNGMENLSTTDADMTGNWWGHKSGPTHTANPEGTGESLVTGYVNYTPWLISQASACGNGYGSFDGTHDAWSFTGTWVGVPIPGLYNDSLHVGATAGGTASLTFYGTHFSLDYLRIPGWGQIGVYLDGSATPLTTINTDGTAALLTYESAELMPATHTVMLKHAGPAGKMIAFDALDIISPVAVASGEIVDGGGHPWNYTGSWTSVPVTGLYEDTLQLGLNPGGTGTLFFNGVGFSFDYLQYTNWGSIVVLVDGSVVQIINSSGSAALQTYTSPPLTAGPHSVMLYNYGPAGKFIGIDVIRVYTVLPP